jgi:TolB-like protein/Tfp pilus assembly protein PilF
MPNKLSLFWQELKRRKVTRVITIYAAAAFVILQLVEILAPSLRLPEWTMSFILVLLIIGFIITVIVSWIYDIHPEGGIVKTEPVEKVKAEDMPKSSNNWKIASYISFVVILLLIVVNILPRLNINRKVLEKSIAVLPLEYLSEDPNKEYLANGVLDAITGHLSMLEGLRVMPRTSVEKYRDNKKSAKEIGEELDVSYLIEGSFQMIGDQVKLIIQVVIAAEGDHIFFSEYDRDYNDILAVQSEVAQTIAKEIEIAISPAERQRIEKAPTYSMDAYHLYQRGEDKYVSYILEDDTVALNEAEVLFNKALEYDSAFALAYVSLAKVYYQKRFFKDLLSETYMDTMYILSEKALSIDHEIAEAYTWRGQFFLLNGDYQKAIKEFEKALQYNPNDERAFRGLGVIYWDVLDDLPKAIQYFQKALERGRGEFYPIYVSNLGLLYGQTGFKELAEQYYKKRLNVDGDSADYYVRLAFLERSYQNSEFALELYEKAIRIDSSALTVYEFYSEVGNYQKQYDAYMEFIRRLERAGEVNAFHNLHRLGYVCWMLDKYDEARAYFNEQIRFSEESIRLNRSAGYSKTPHYDLAGVYAFLGQREKAYQYLREWETRKSFPLWWVSLFQTDPMFDSIRNEPEFQQILQDVEAKYQAEHEQVRQWLEENDLL